MAVFSIGRRYEVQNNQLVRIDSMVDTDTGEQREVASDPNAPVPEAMPETGAAAPGFGQGTFTQPGGEGPGARPAPEGMEFTKLPAPGGYGGIAPYGTPPGDTGQWTGTGQPPGGIGQWNTSYGGSPNMAYDPNDPRNRTVSPLTGQVQPGPGIPGTGAVNTTPGGIGMQDIDPIRGRLLYNWEDAQTAVENALSD